MKRPRCHSTHVSKTLLLTYQQQSPTLAAAPHRHACSCAAVWDRRSSGAFYHPLHPNYQSRPPPGPPGTGCRQYTAASPHCHCCPVCTGAAAAAPTRCLHTQPAAARSSCTCAGPAASCDRRPACPGSRAASAGGCCCRHCRGTSSRCCSRRAVRRRCWRRSAGPGRPSAISAGCLFGSVPPRQLAACRLTPPACAHRCASIPDNPQAARRRQACCRHRSRCRPRSCRCRRGRLTAHTLQPTAAPTSATPQPPLLQRPPPQRALSALLACSTALLDPRARTTDACPGHRPGAVLSRRQDPPAADDAWSAVKKLR